MGLLSESLSVWEIGFRWAEDDPDRWWWRIPLPVRDNFRVLMEAILKAHLPCLTLSLDKRDPTSEDPPELFIRHHLDDVEACIHGGRYDRSLLRWARVERFDFKDWCERRGIPLPEFWFPPGWNQAYQWPSDDEPEDAAAVKVAGQVEAAPSGSNTKVEEESPIGGLRPVQRAKIACQQIASVLWSMDETKDLTIKSMAARREIEILGGGGEWDMAVVQRWLSEVDPRDPRTKRGRRKGS